MKKILIISAHPDDEILGCGGTVLKHTFAGDEVHVCIVTTSDSRWSDEYRKLKVEEGVRVDQILNVEQRHYCNLPTTALNHLPSHRINDEISKVVNAVNPDIVYTHFSSDVNQDHRVIFNATLVCCRPIKKAISIRCFETLSSSEWGENTFTPNFFVTLSKQEIDLKIKAFLQYESEVKKYPHPRSPEGIENLAKFRGNQICKNFAEAFIIVRQHWD